MAVTNRPGAAGHVAFTYPAFTLYISARFFMVVALEMQSVAVGWQVYEITRKPLDLGMVGLAQFLPRILLFLVSGHAADRYNRRTVLLLTYVGFMLCSCLLLEYSMRGTRSIVAIYAI